MVSAILLRIRAGLASVPVIAVSFALLLNIPLQSRGLAQTVPFTDVRQRDQCARCAFVATEIQVLGKDGTGPANSTGIAAVDSRGNFFVDGETPTEFSVFNSKGQFVRSVGRRGSGPGEFERITDVQVGSHDSVWVYDSRQNTFSIYAPGAERFVRQVKAGLFIASWLTVSPSSDLVVGFDRPTQRDSGRTVFVLNDSGKVVRAIGATEVITSRTPIVPQQRVFGRARSPYQFWTARALSPTIELLDSRGNVRRRVSLSDRVVPFSAPGRGGAAPVRPRIMAIREDSLGRLWIWFSRPNPRFQSPTGGHYRLEDLVDSKLPVRNPTETVLQVIDIARATVVAETVEIMPFLFLGSDLFIKTTGTAEALTLTILKVELTGVPGAIR